MDFDRLALETFEMKGDFQGKNPFFDDAEESQVLFDLFTDDHDQIRNMLYPKSPGVIYRIDRGGSTFCLRGMPTTDIATSFDHYQKNETQVLKALRLEAFNDEHDVYFFETHSFELAQIVSDQYLKRRLPLNEEMVCNISDPGFSWWFCEKEDGFLLSFKTTGFHDNLDLINLGPIGDRKVASLVLRECIDLFSLVLKHTQLSCSEKAFQVQSEELGHLYLIELRNLFLKGERAERLEQYFEKNQNKTLGFYFRELSVLRSFWIELQGQLFPYS